MKILAIETSSLAGGIALMDEERLIAEYRLHVDVRHAERIMVAIDRLLKDSKTALAECDAITVSIGPGAFTGLRVGLATAKGLAFGAGIDLVAVPTLEVMAAAFPYAKPLIAPFVDARRGEVYWALFDCGKGNPDRLIEDAACTPDLALETIFLSEASRGRGVLFVGDGSMKYRETILKKLPSLACFATRALQFPSAVNAAELGLARLLKGDFIPAELVKPAYIRASAAELKRGCI